MQGPTLTVWHDDNLLSAISCTKYIFLLDIYVTLQYVLDILQVISFVYLSLWSAGVCICTLSLGGLVPHENYGFLLNNVLEATAMSIQDQTQFMYSEKHNMCLWVYFRPAGKNRKSLWRRETFGQRCRLKV